MSRFVGSIAPPRTSLHGASATKAGARRTRKPVLTIRGASCRLHLPPALDLGGNLAFSDHLLANKEADRDNTGLEAKEVLADAGYRSEKNFQELEARGQTAFIPLGRKGSKATPAINKKLVATHRMKRRMATKRGRSRYKRRKHIAEAPFGWIKNVLGFRSFHLRGVDAVRGEWNLICMAVNLRRMGIGLM